LDLSELCENAQRGDKTAENQLFEHLSVRFSSIAGHRIWNQQDAEEVCQVALKTIWEKYREINFEKSFAAWAHKVLDNKVRKFYEEKRRNQNNIGTLDKEGVYAGSPENPDPNLRRKLLDCLKMINRTNNRYARVIVLQFQGYKTQEICRRLKITRSHLYVLLSRSRSLLRLCLDTGKID